MGSSDLLNSAGIIYPPLLVDPIPVCVRPQTGRAAITWRALSGAATNPRIQRQLSYKAKGGPVHNGLRRGYATVTKLV